MPQKVGHTIRDILETIERIEARVGGATFAEFQSDWEFRYAIQRAIEIDIGQGHLGCHTEGIAAVEIGH
jgi:uncharacterized protein with HEPN domain